MTLLRSKRLDSHADNKVTWLILPVVICLSKRLSHASASDSVHPFSLREGTQDDCERLIKTVIGSGWSEEQKEDKGVKIELKRGRGISTRGIYCFSE